MSSTPISAPLPPLEENLRCQAMTPVGSLMANPYGDDGDEVNDEEDDVIWDFDVDDGSKALSVLNQLASLDEDHPISFINVDPTISEPCNLGIEDLLAKELSKLSFEEQEKAAFDVHGFCNGLRNTGVAIAEATDEEEEKLIELDRELKKLKADPSNTLIQRKDFRLMFLRCEDLHAKVAAQRIIKNLEIKKKKFGAHTADRHLQHSDLDDNDLQVLESNFIQVSPQRDAAGRFVVIHVADARPANVTQLNCFRAVFYLFSSLAQDPQVQRQGCVGVALGNRVPGKLKKETVANLNFFSRLTAGLPHKMTALHFCMDTGTSNPDRTDARLIRVFMAAVQLMVKSTLRDRFRTHFALRETIHFQMKSYGILLEEHYWPILPRPPPLVARLTSSDTSCSGNTNEDSDVSFMTTSTQMEPSTGTSQMEPSTCTYGTAIRTPTDKDVLLGRGKRTRNHAGNLNAKSVVDAYRPEYERAKKFEKTAIAERIVHLIQAQGGRFLKEETGKKGEWFPVDNQTARNKISHLYRNTKKSFFGLK